MWLFTPDGFFSAVQYDKDPGKLLIRARRRDDLKDLLSAIGGGPAIFEDKTADYRYRLLVSREVFAQYMFDAVMGIEYRTSVKDALDKGQEDRHRAMLRVWTAMGDIQPGGPYGMYWRHEASSPGQRSFTFDPFDPNDARWDDDDEDDVDGPDGPYGDLSQTYDDSDFDDHPDDGTVFSYVMPATDSEHEVAYEVDDNGKKHWYDMVTGEYLGEWT